MAGLGNGILARDHRRGNVLDELERLAKEIERLKRAALQVEDPSWGGATDHGDLTGLGDDDHAQYLTSGRHAALSSDLHDPKAHTHVENDVTDLDHDAQKIKGVTVDDAAKADGRVLAYEQASQTLKYVEQAGGDTALANVRALTALTSLPLSTGQCWVLAPMARSGNDLVSLPWGTLGAVNAGSWASGFLDSGVPYCEFDGSSWYGWPDGAKTDPRYNLSWVGWVYFTNAASSVEKIASKHSGGSDVTWILTRRDTGELRFCTTTDGSTQRNLDSTLTLAQTTWYCLGFSYGYSSEGMRIFAGKKDGSYEWKENTGYTGVLYDNGQDYTLGASAGGAGGRLTGRLVRPVALISEVLPLSWFQMYLDATRCLF